MRKEIIKVGVLGAGPLNMTHHIPHIVQNPNASLEMVCDLNRQRLEECKRRFQPKKVTPSYDEMLSEKEIDLIMIATQPSLQYELAKKSLLAGKHTFVEKPMAEEAEKCLELAKLAKEKGVQLATGYNRRFTPVYQDLKAIVKKYSSPPVIYYRIVDDFRDGRLKRVIKEGRSQLIEETCHIFDLVCWLCEDKPEEVCNMSLLPLMHVTLVRLTRGGVATIITGGRGTMAWPKEGIEVFLEHAVVRIDDFVEMYTANVKDWPDQIRRYPGIELEGWGKGHAKILEWEGLSRMLYYRREWQRIWNEEGLASLLEEIPDTERVATIKRKVGKLPHINYMVNKGWQEADDALINALKEGKPFENANGFDAAISLVCAQAAVLSNKERRTVKIEASPEKIIMK
jgi:predicted dehydrogenase